MELNEIKKILYKDKPMAVFLKASNVALQYHCTVKKDELEDMNLYFHIPIRDMGDAVFEMFMPAQQLIRWLVIPETEK